MALAHPAQHESGSHSNGYTCTDKRYVSHSTQQELRYHRNTHRQNLRTCINCIYICMVGTAWYIPGSSSEVDDFVEFLELVVREPSQEYLAAIQEDSLTGRGWDMVVFQ